MAHALTRLAHKLAVSRRRKRKRKRKKRKKMTETSFLEIKS